MAVEKSRLRKLLWWRRHCLSSPAINVNLGWRGGEGPGQRRQVFPLPPSLHPSYHPPFKTQRRREGGKKCNRRFTTTVEQKQIE